MSGLTLAQAEETHDASRTVPRAMTYGYLASGLLAISMLLPSLVRTADGGADPAFPQGPLGFFYLYNFFTETQTAFTVSMFGLLVFLVNWATVSRSIAMASRQTFAFARDGGLPFAPWLSTIQNTV